MLLVGDAAQIATPSASGGASDPSYSKLAGGDDYPDILVGRFSAETAAQVDTQVLRTIEYEQMPRHDDRLVQSAAWASRRTRVPAMTANTTTSTSTTFAMTCSPMATTLVDQIYDYSGTAAQVTSGLNAGRGIINYCASRQHDVVELDRLLEYSRERTGQRQHACRSSSASRA